MVYPVSQSSIFFNSFDAQHQNGDSSGDTFQSELDEFAVSDTATTGPVSLWDYGSTLTTSTSTGMSTALWELEVKDAPKTIEEMQKELDAASDALATEFLEFAEMSLEERIRANILREKDMTEEQLAALDPDMRETIEEEIKQAILRALGVEEAKNEAAETGVELAA